MTDRPLFALLLALVAVPSASALTAPSVPPVPPADLEEVSAAIAEVDACVPASSICVQDLIACAEDLCFDDMVCDSPGGYGESVLGPAPGAVGASIGPLNTESPEEGTFGPYVGTGVDPQGC